MPNALVVADDLTGAMDTGHGFAARGRAVRVRRAAGGDAIDTDAAGADAAGETLDPDGGDVLVVDTDSRDAAPAVAAAAVARAVDAAPADLVYKKVDSTLRGNVVAEVDAALGGTEADLAVVAPAFPATGRTTEDGRHLVDGTPLSDAGYGVAESDLREVFGRSEHAVARLDAETADAGAERVADRLAAAATGDGPTLVVCDALTDAHLAALAEGAASLAEPPLYVGSGGLAAHVTVPGRPPDGATGVGSPADGAASDRRRSGALGVVGSVNERTLAQLAAVEDDRVVALDPAAAATDPDAAG
ncbi:MAG: four-carbon acid sugar kinase family protein, partial [Halosimplex sp.]